MSTELTDFRRYGGLVFSLDFALYLLTARIAVEAAMEAVKEAVSYHRQQEQNDKLMNVHIDGSGGLGDNLKKQNWDPASLSKFEKNF